MFDDSDAEALYKLVKQLRLLREQSCFVGSLIFNFLFDRKIIQQIESRAILFEETMKRYQLACLIQPELIINLGFFFFVRFEGLNMERQISTVFMKLYQCELFSKEFLLLWENDDQNLADFMTQHPLYSRENDRRLKAAAADFLGWLREESEDGSEEEIDSQDEHSQSN